MSEDILAVHISKSRDWPQINYGFAQNKACAFLWISPASLHYCHQCLSHCRKAINSILTLACCQQLFIEPQTHFESFQSEIMSSSVSSRPAQWSLPLTVCLYFYSVMSSVFIVAGSLALVIAGACWVRWDSFDSLSNFLHEIVNIGTWGPLLLLRIHRNVLNCFVWSVVYNWKIILFTIKDYCRKAILYYVYSYLRGWTEAVLFA